MLKRFKISNVAESREARLLNTFSDYERTSRTLTSRERANRVC